jgi:hypothetical protein
MRSLLRVDRPSTNANLHPPRLHVENAGPCSAYAIDDARHRQTFVKKMVTVVAGAVVDLRVVNDPMELCLAKGLAELV